MRRQRYYISIYAVAVRKRRNIICAYVMLLYEMEKHYYLSPLCCHEKTTIKQHYHYNDVITGAMASQITSLAIVYSTVYSGTDQRKHQSSASLAFVWPVNSPHKRSVTRKMFRFDDVIMTTFVCFVAIRKWENDTSILVHIMLLSEKEERTLYEHNSTG